MKKSTEEMRTILKKHCDNMETCIFQCALFNFSDDECDCWSAYNLNKLSDKDIKKICSILIKSIEEK